MAIDDLAHLRAELPEVFADVPLPAAWEDDWLFIPVDDPEAENAYHTDDVAIVDPWLNSADSPDALAPSIPELPESAADLSLSTTFAGAPHRGGWTSPMPPPDAFAFYLPFHYFYPTWWGVYIILENAQVLANYISACSGGALSQREALTAVRIFLYAHEAFHHIVEAFATRLEITHRTALYKTKFQALFERTVNTDLSIEEMLATAHGYRRVKERFASNDPNRREAALEGLRRFISQCPPGYRRAAEAFRSPAFEDSRSEFAEQNHIESFPHIPKKAAALWSCFPHAFSGISRVTSRVNYAVRRDSPLAARFGLNLRYLRYRELREKLLTLAKCEPVRQGAGSHEIWRNPQGKTFPVPRHPGDLHRGLLASIIKQAGLQMSVSQFLST